MERTGEEAHCRAQEVALTDVEFGMKRLDMFRNEIGDHPRHMAVETDPNRVSNGYIKGVKGCTLRLAGVKALNATFVICLREE